MQSVNIETEFVSRRIRVMQRLAAASFLISLCALAQPGDRVEVRRAEFRPGGDELKCRIEVVVDGAAEVSIRGDSAELRTLSGQRAEWRRFICSQPMPMNPAEFRFSGVDGRGRQTLIREPGRGGPAVIRIEDPQGGREGYTFDIFWRGGAGGYGDHNPGRYPDRSQGPQGGGQWNGQRGDEFNYRGDGRGFLNRKNGPDIPVRDVVVSLNRDGRVVVEFEAKDFRRIVFGGHATRVSKGFVGAELTSTGRDRDTRGSALIYMDRGGQVERVTLKGRMDGDPFTLEWSAR
jgi:hypothetical protein